MIIPYDNLVGDATITASTENPDYDFTTAFNDKRLSRVGRTTDDDDEWIKFSFTGAVSVSCVCILDNNISSSATITLEGNATDVWTSPSFSQSITTSDLFDGIYLKTFTTQSYQYWRLWIDDASNPDTYIQVSQVFLGTYTTFPGMNPGLIVGPNSNSIATKSPSGQLYGDRRIQSQGAEINFTDVSNTNKIAVQTFTTAVDVTECFIMCIWEDSLDIQAPIYCSLIEIPQFQRSQSHGLLWNFSLKIEECF